MSRSRTRLFLSRLDKFGYAGREIGEHWWKTARCFRLLFLRADEKGGKCGEMRECRDV
jgi:hypothetical protein